MPKFAPYTPAFITDKAEPPMEFTEEDGWLAAPIAQRVAAAEGFSAWLKAEPDGRGRVWVRAWFAGEEAKLPIGYIEATQAELFVQASGELAAISAMLAAFNGSEEAYTAGLAGVNLALGELCKRLMALKLEDSREAAWGLSMIAMPPVEAGELKALTDGVAALATLMPAEYARSLGG